MSVAIEWSREEVLRRVDINADGCWIYRGKPQRDGYALITSRGRCTAAHRFVYKLLVGPIPDDKPLDHTCHTKDEVCAGGTACSHRRCVNPEHLEPVTDAENAQRAKGKITHCPSGHEYAGWNLIRYRGRRYCRACIYARRSESRGRAA